MVLVGLIGLLAPPAIAQEGAPSNDPLYGDQWALAQIGAPCVWMALPPRQNVIVAIVDSGVDAGHPDLVGRVRDDGYDFVDDDADPRDENGHGTHVAGIIAAQLNNGEGGAGLAPIAQILPVRVVGPEGAGSDRSIAAGIDFAVERGARVINLSIGSTLLLATPESSPLISRSIARAIAAGVVVVVAAGNDFLPLPNAIIGDNEAVLVVAATTRDNQRARFSNSGPWVDVSAPGERILSTMPTYEVYLTGPELPLEERFAPLYDTMSGTSQAAPFVSALAALLIAQNPDLTPAEVSEAIITGSADIYDGLPSYYRRLRLLGAGRIDACASLTGMPRPAPADWLVPTAWGLGLSLVALLGLLALMRQRRRESLQEPPAAAPSAPEVTRLGDTVAGASALPVWGRLRRLDDDRLFLLRDEIILIGRAEECTLRFSDDSEVSRRHARIIHRGDTIWLEDLGSSFGTQLNRRKLRRPTKLQPGDLITIGTMSFRFEARRS
ncbi:MAG: S8 family serine peptidase [Oscillochloris sp.]|nr:S8 family serine peptidase [Oscillochloris sp.]